MIQCKLCKIINVVSVEDVVAIQEALDADYINNTQLAEVLTNNGYPLTEASVRRHLRHFNKDTNVNRK